MLLGQIDKSLHATQKFQDFLEVISRFSRHNLVSFYLVLMHIHEVVDDDLKPVVSDELCDVTLDPLRDL